MATVDERRSKLLAELDRIEAQYRSTDLELRFCRALRAALDGTTKTGLGMILRAWEAE